MKLPNDWEHMDIATFQRIFPRSHRRFVEQCEKFGMDAQSISEIHAVDVHFDGDEVIEFEVCEENHS